MTVKTWLQRYPRWTDPVYPMPEAITDRRSLIPGLLALAGSVSIVLVCAVVVFVNLPH